MVKKTVEFPPSPKMIHSMRRTGYEWLEAVMDILDNGVDALKKKDDQGNLTDGFVRVHYDLVKGKVEKIFIIDNGVGVPKKLMETGLLFCMGESEKRGINALGTFGMGLKTAGMSLGDRTTVISRTSSTARPVSVSWSAEESLRADKFIGTYDTQIPATTYGLFKDYLADTTGTIVIIEDLYDELLPRGGAAVARTKRLVSHVYRHMLNKNSTLSFHFPFDIYIGKDTTSPVEKAEDPLVIGDKKTAVLIGDKAGNFEKKSFRGQDFWVRMVHHKARSVTQRHPNVGKYCGRGSQRQGVYFIRGGREICSQAVWTPRQSLSNVFAEIVFEDSGVGCTSESLKVNFGKTRAVLQTDFKSFLENTIFGPHLNKLQSDAKKAAVASRKSNKKSLMDEVAAVSLPVEDFGRARKPPSASASAAASEISAANSSGPQKKGSKHRGTTIMSGNSQLQLEFVEECWRGSPLPFDIDFGDGKPTLKILVNVAHPWVEKNCYLNTNDEVSKYCFQQLAAMALAVRGLSFEQKDEVLGAYGKSLIVFDDQFGSLMFPQSIGEEEEEEEVLHIEESA